MAASTADLTTVSEVYLQGWGGPVADPSSTLVQALVTSISRHIQFRTGRSVLNTETIITDTLDGSGGDKQFTREFPIQAFNQMTVKVFGQTVPPSPDGVNPGWVVDSYGASVVLLPGTAIGGPISYSAWLIPLGRFPHGRQNVVITYEAGYVPGGGPGPHPPSDPLYNGAPSDLGQCVTEFCVQQLKKREWVDIANKTMTQTGENIRFRDWELPPFLMRVIETYKRTWLV